MNKKIIIKADHDVTNTLDALRYLKDKYKNKKMEFVGWSAGKRVINIDDENYYLSSCLKQILLKETKAKTKILETKVDKFENYNNILKKKVVIKNERKDIRK